MWLANLIIILLCSGFKKAISLGLILVCEASVTAFMFEDDAVDGVAICVHRCSCDVWWVFTCSLHSMLRSQSCCSGGLVTTSFDIWTPGGPKTQLPHTSYFHIILA